MDGLQESPHSPMGRQLIVKADEVDQIGTAIQSPSKQLPLSALEQHNGAPLVPGSGTSELKNKRPPLRRDGSAPPPPSVPPPPAPFQQQQPPSDTPTDSLSLPQLKQLVSQFPKAEQRAYTFQYADAQSFANEIEDWFHYSEQDGAMILNSKDTFERRWGSSLTSSTAGAEDDQSLFVLEESLRTKILPSALSSLNHPLLPTRIESLEVIFYLLGGTWAITAGREADEQPVDQLGDDHDDQSHKALQMEWMHKGADLLLKCCGLQKLLDTTRRAFDEEESLMPAAAHDERSEHDDEEVGNFRLRERALLLSCWYIVVESAWSRSESPAGRSIREAFLLLRPNFLVYWVEILARQRWEDVSELSMTARILTLFWKSILLILGGSGDAMENIKRLLQPRDDPSSTDAAQPMLTASPLDYHLFRQEITSKYPAYNPPLPLVPFELEHKSILPPLPHHPSRANALAGSVAGSSQLDGNVSGSILHQPVHIATPAPSPPPSPNRPGGKAGKKQNYQTNQNFPFLYPPLDNSSNNIGGKGSTEFQDLMVGRKWEGSDIPASIIEAGQLFASRMRMTRAMRQLWKERELFLKDERGWEGDSPSVEQGQTSVKEQDGSREVFEAGLRAGEEPSVAEELEERLAFVESFFHLALPSLQSVVIVMMKTMLSNIQQIAAQNDSVLNNGPSPGLPKTKSNLKAPQTSSSPNAPTPPQAFELNIGELNDTRLREVCHKAISGALFLLLKWFKLSHVLKFEYLTQLLLDSNYIPLVLKYFAHQNLEDLVATKYDRDDLGFFHFCHLHSNQPPPSPESAAISNSPHSSPDEAVPPPILRRRRSATSAPPNDPSQLTVSPEELDGGSSPNRATDAGTDDRAGQPAPPSVDELGHPLAPIPKSPITTFSFRQFQTSIHLLRVLQKITRGKGHRILLLVQYKSSQILRRILRVPDPTLRLYALKLFKSQVPYCDRKWRQSNMKVITAIYLHCRPELRDEWLAGMHDQSAEGEVDEALPLEWALRGLTFWWMKRKYSDVVGPTPAIAGSGVGDTDLAGHNHGIQDSERDFFQRQLDQMGWGMAATMSGFGHGSNGLGSDDSDAVAFGEEALGANAMANGDGNGDGVTDGNGNGYGYGNDDVNTREGRGKVNENMDISDNHRGYSGGSGGDGDGDGKASTNGNSNNNGDGDGNGNGNGNGNETLNQDG